MRGVRGLPREVKHLLNAGAWVVGSSALGFEKGRDIDLLVPFGCWHLAQMLLPSNSVPTSLGGWRFHREGWSVDVWPADLSAYLTKTRKPFWSPVLGLRFVLDTSTPTD